MQKTTVFNAQQGMVDIGTLKGRSLYCYNYKRRSYKKQDQAAVLIGNNDS